MHIEKINEHKIKFILSKDDLKDQNIKFSELAYGSDKAQSFFMDMMEEAYEKFGFTADNTPLMIEAIPLNEDSIMILVTKVSSAQEIDQKLGDVIDIEQKTKKPRKTTSRKRNVSKSSKIIYQFDEFEHIPPALTHLPSLEHVLSSLYKFESKYYLVLQAASYTIKEKNGIHSSLSEYGKEVYSSPLTEDWLNERAEVLIASRALEIFNEYFK